MEMRKTSAFLKALIILKKSFIEFSLFALELELKMNEKMLKFFHAIMNGRGEEGGVEGQFTLHAKTFDLSYSQVKFIRVHKGTSKTMHI